MRKFGKLPPLYRFILNPHVYVRFSTCPECSKRTLLRKVPLVVHVQPHHPTLINKHSRYCPDCDLLIAHQDELEAVLVQAYRDIEPGLIGNDYFVLGTVDKSTWRKRGRLSLDMGNIPKHLHDFKEYLVIKYKPAGWYPGDTNN